MKIQSQDKLSNYGHADEVKYPYAGHCRTFWNLEIALVWNRCTNLQFLGLLIFRCTKLK